ncbi:hypothetical protein [Caulobacter sp. UNC279MFTsu5.1]|uniref:hypothetical protein n=1 Tax=Caulobacter sp. UNC279MFTsu5.1 TaxID=1502775 RepID=UPI0008F090EA|nr:hypothetical protein [Caulobacter sp. UNC279MFTsu5.1]SFJ68459.1 hypothetical protein SAMN02799626_02331 [Caulobacter sp. UNC279MFTsu5.1]
MNPRRRLDILTPVVRLRERRVEVARLEAVAARDALAAAEDALAARERAIAAHDAALARLDAWFAEGLSGSAAMVETALARREMVADARARDVALRDQDRLAVQQAREDLDTALRVLVRAQGRFEAMSGQRDHARWALLAQRDERQQQELEDLPARRAAR